jgi:hypothetical protein
MSTDISEENFAFLFRVEEKGKVNAGGKEGSA